MTRQPRNCFITGGSSGVGLELARQLLASGENVLIIGRDPERLAAAASTLEAPTGNRGACRSLLADVRRNEDLLRISQSMAEAGQSIDFLVMNAGIVEADAVADMSMCRLEDVLETNLAGAVRSVKALLPLVPDGGRLLFIASGFGIVHPAGYAAYCASKAGMIAFAASLKRELRSRRITVQVACLTDTETPQYRIEMKIRPAWMCSRSGISRKAMPVQEAVAKTLKKTRSGRFFIFVSFDVLIGYLLTKILPQCLNDRLMDLLFPIPCRYPSMPRSK